jgi:hypothetical protein
LLTAPDWWLVRVLERLAGPVGIAVGVGLSTNRARQQPKRDDSGGDKGLHDSSPDMICLLARGVHVAERCADMDEARKGLGVLAET